MTEETSTLIVPNDEYLKAGIHIGTKFRTKYMSNFIYKTRSDGLSVLNIQAIDERLKLAAKMLSHYAPEDILVVCRRETGVKPVQMFGKATGAKVFAGRYPPGTMTNPALKYYTEAKIMLVGDAWPDKNAVDDALKAGIPVIALCDTNNQSNNIDLVIPCNNKGKKSLGLVFWVLAKLYMEYRGLSNKGQAFGYSIDDFSEE
jgi:small subunit ribosomal protein S2